MVKRKKTDRPTAERLVKEFLQREYREYLSDSGDELVLVPEATLEKSYGWVFFFQNRKYLETSDPMECLLDFGPVLFLDSDHSIHRLGFYWREMLSKHEADIRREQVRHLGSKLLRFLHRHPR